MRTGTGSSRYATRLGVAITMLAVVTSCGSKHEPAGAAAPPRPEASGAGTGRAGATSAPAPPVDAPAAARTVEDYFQEINDAVQTGRPANVGPTALTGCQPCALDLGVARSLQQRGLHADGPAYQVDDVHAQPRIGLVAEVGFTLRTRTVGLLDAAGRPVSDAPGVPDRAGTAELSLTGDGWRILILRYAVTRS